MDNGVLVYTKDGKTSNETTLCKYNGEWYYIHNGKDNMHIKGCVVGKTYQVICKPNYGAVDVKVITKE